MNGNARHHWGSRLGSRVLLGALLGTLTWVGACEEVDLAVPNAREVESAYAYEGSLKASMNGNVAEITIEQPARQLRRGGTLWAKVGPYVLLFSKETEGLFETYPGLAGVRVITRSSDDGEVARALLTRDALNDLTWRRAINIAGRARKSGTAKPTLLEDLVRWGEDHTQHEYNSRYTRS